MLSLLKIRAELNRIARLKNSEQRLAARKALLFDINEAQKPHLEVILGLKEPSITTIPARYSSRIKHITQPSREHIETLYQHLLPYLQLSMHEEQISQEVTEEMTLQLSLIFSLATEVKGKKGVEFQIDVCINNALKYLETYQQKHPNAQTPIRDACDFDIDPSLTNLTEWQKNAITKLDDPVFRKQMLIFASSIDQLIESDEKESKALQKRAKEIDKLNKGDEQERELAKQLKTQLDIEQLGFQKQFESFYNEIFIKDFATSLAEEQQIAEDIQKLRAKTKGEKLSKDELKQLKELSAQEGSIRKSAKGRDLTDTEKHALADIADQKRPLKEKSEGKPLTDTDKEALLKLEARMKVIKKDGKERIKNLTKSEIDHLVNSVIAALKDESTESLHYQADTHQLDSVTHYLEAVLQQQNQIYTNLHGKLGRLSASEEAAHNQADKNIAHINVALRNCYAKLPSKQKKQNLEMLRAYLEDIKAKDPVIQHFKKNNISSKKAMEYKNLDRSNAGKNLPDIGRTPIDGAVIGYPGFYIRLIPVQDGVYGLKGATLGREADICQYIGGVGEPCAKHLLTSANGGAYVMFKGDSNSPSADDPVVAQAWSWMGVDGEFEPMVFDSLEPSERKFLHNFHQYREKIDEPNYLEPSERAGVKALSRVQKFYEYLSFLAVESGECPAVYTGSIAGLSGFFGANTGGQYLANFKDYNEYNDSSRQSPVITRNAPYYLFSSILYAELTDDHPVKNRIEGLVVQFLEKQLSRESLVSENQELIDFLAYIHNHKNAQAFFHKFVHERRAELQDTYKAVSDYIESLDSIKEDKAIHIPNPLFINLFNKQCQTALVCAIKKRNIAFANELIDETNININLYQESTTQYLGGNKSISEDGQAALGQILRHMEYVKQFDNSKYWIEGEQRDAHRQLALKLISKGAKVDTTNQYEMTPLMFAAALGELEIVKAMLSNDININQADHRFETALHHAIDGGNVEVVRELINNGADLNATESYDQTPLISAIIEGHQEIVKLLLESGARIDIADNVGNSALHWALEKEELAIAAILLQYNPPLHLQNEQGSTPLMVSLNYGAESHEKIPQRRNAFYHQLSAQMIERMPIKTLNLCNKKGSPALRSAYEATRGGNNPDLMHQILAKGKDINAFVLNDHHLLELIIAVNELNCFQSFTSIDTKLLTDSLMRCIKNNYINDTVKYIIENHADVILDAVSQTKILKWAFEHKQFDFLDFLQSERDMKIPSSFYTDTLADEEKFNYLQHHQIPIEIDSTRNECSLLRGLVIEKNMPSQKVSGFIRLIEAGANLYVDMLNDDQTLLENAVEREPRIANAMLNQGEIDKFTFEREIVRPIDSHGAEPTHKTIKRSILQYAIKGGHQELLQRLVSLGAKIDFIDSEGNTLLMYAVKGEYALIDYLMGTEIDIHHRNAQGQNVLDIAIEAHNYPLAKKLINMGVTINTKLPYYQNNLDHDINELLIHDVIANQNIAESTKKDELDTYKAILENFDFHVDNPKHYQIINRILIKSSPLLETLVHKGVLNANTNIEGMRLIDYLITQASVRSITSSSIRVESYRRSKSGILLSLLTLELPMTDTDKNNIFKLALLRTSSGDDSLLRHIVKEKQKGSTYLSVVDLNTQCNGISVVGLVRSGSEADLELLKSLPKNMLTEPSLLSSALHKSQLAVVAYLVKNGVTITDDNAFKKFFSKRIVDYSLSKSDIEDAITILKSFGTRPAVLDRELSLKFIETIIKDYRDFNLELMHLMLDHDYPFEELDLYSRLQLSEKVQTKHPDDQKLIAKIEAKVGHLGVLQMNEFIDNVAQDSFANITFMLDNRPYDEWEFDQPLDKPITHMVCEQCALGCFKALIQQKSFQSALSVIDPNHGLPLHLLIQAKPSQIEKADEMIKMMLEKCPELDLKATNAQGQTPAELAMALGHETLAAKLDSLVQQKELARQAKVLQEQGAAIQLQCAALSKNPIGIDAAQLEIIKRGQEYELFHLMKEFTGKNSLQGVKKMMQAGVTRLKKHIDMDKLNNDHDYPFLVYLATLTQRPELTSLIEAVIQWEEKVQSLIQDVGGSIEPVIANEVIESKTQILAEVDTLIIHIADTAQVFLLEQKKSAELLNDGDVLDTSVPQADSSKK